MATALQSDAIAGISHAAAAPWHTLLPLPSKSPRADAPRNRHAREPPAPPAGARPQVLLTSKLCPRDLESTTYALLAGFQNFGSQARRAEDGRRGGRTRRQLQIWFYWSLLLFGNSGHWRPGPKSERGTDGLHLVHVESVRRRRGVSASIVVGNVYLHVLLAI